MKMFSMEKNFIRASLVLALSTMTVGHIATAAVSKVRVDAKASSFEWKGSKITGSTHNGAVTIKEGEVQLDGSKLTGGKIAIDMTTISNIDLTDKTYNDKLVTHLKSEDFFDVVKFPVSELTIKDSELQKDGTYKVKADLQIKNETHPVIFNAKVGAGGKEAQTELIIDRTDWNIRYGSGKFFKNLGDKVISDKMEFKIKLVFVNPINPAKK